ncbi:MAG: phospholipid scramblase-related protein [Leptospirales bacterium]
MDEELKRNVFLVKEHTGIFKAANNYDIYDPETNKIILECREEGLGFISKILRFTDYKRMTPFNIVIKNLEGKQIVRVKRGISIFLSNVEVLDENNTKIGGFKQKFFSIGGKFDVFNAQDELVCNLKGKWTGWNFSFLYQEQELAHVTKKWAGVGKELFTSADNYAINISDSVDAEHPARKLILAAVMCIDMVLKE